MAAFKDQFKILDPFKIPRRPEFFGWIPQIGAEASRALRGRDVNWLTDVARSLDSFIEKQSLRADLGGGGPKQLQAILARELMSSPYVTRDWYGDVQLFTESESQHNWANDPVKTERWERYAVLSLWKVVDAYMALDGHLDAPPDLARSALEAMRWNHAGGYAVEAMNALQIAQIELLEIRHRSKRGKHLSDKRHAPSRGWRDVALRLAEDRPFRSMPQAIEYIRLELTKQGAFFASLTIRNWLIRAKWKAQHRR